MKQYQPLYLKYRPQSLGELVGQEVVSKTLTNAINFNRIVHAYLFCGPRGTGKTSTARILAKSLNCEKGVTEAPCGGCASCKSITEGSSLDVIEIDAASHRKVEDAEDLINRVNLGTYGSRYKVYIIDEVHMLTDHAFNALLKTLEEPPKNVIFILATTEEYKVIQTIISRCQKLDFKVIPKAKLENRIKEISEKEKIKIPEEIINFISKRSNGCLRDAISLLDQISVLQEEETKINSKDVYELFGTVGRKEIFELVKAILLLDKQNAISLAENLVKSGKDIGELFKSLLEVVMDIGKTKINPEYRKNIEEELGEDLSFVENINKNHVLKMMEKLQASQTKLRFALSQELQFIMEVLSMLDDDFTLSLVELDERVKSLEGGKPIQRPQQSPMPVAKKEESPKQEIKEAIQESSEEEEKEPEDLPSDEAITSSQVSDKDESWKKIVSSIESIPTKTLLTQSESYLISISDEVIEIGISKDMFLPRLKNDDRKKDMILKACKLISGLNPSEVRYVIKPGNSPLKTEVKAPEPAQKTNTEQQATTTPSVESKPQSNGAPGETDDFTRAVSDLLGAQPLE